MIDTNLLFKLHGVPRRTLNMHNTLISTSLGATDIRHLGRFIPEGVVTSTSLTISIKFTSNPKQG